ncbi:VWA domain-containing protein [Lignipirellula cremea]|uniref:von Willebrand factor type A domain protein n=1 Tax=Lignipirellula cremea TaxID=2528010 RepID=A0A518DUF2_9BACT|nr:VWA domain-containing protein [Lignipirellula cremea]QDU95467.1 von Willebrand factor type A domain protein [Lignipirellula cremea]
MSPCISIGSRRRSGLRARRGAMIVLLSFMMVVILIFAAISIDVAQMHLTRTQLRTATDAASRAAAEALSRTQSQSAAEQAALDTAEQNSVAGAPFELRTSQVEFGSTVQGDDGAWVFVAGVSPPNAVRVYGDRTSASISGSVPLFFGGLHGNGDFEPQLTSTAHVVDRDIVLVLDRSGSMAWDLTGVDWSYPPGLVYPESYCLAPHSTQSRWAAAVAATNSFVVEINKTIQEEKLGLVTYASAGNWCDKKYLAAETNRQLTTDYPSVLSTLASRSQKPIPGGTSISAGIDYGVAAVTNPNTSRPLASKTIVLMTDGVHNQGRSPVDAAIDAEAAGVVIHAITFSNGADQAQMKQVAAVTGGKHLHAPDAAALIKAFKEIAGTVPVVLTE